MWFDPWLFVPIALVGLAAVVVVAALWPPVSGRRVATAILLSVASAVVVWATLSPTLTLPDNLVVAVECKAFADEGLYDAAIQPHLAGRQIFSETTTVVLDDGQCGTLAAARGAQVASGSDLDAAMKAGQQAFAAMTLLGGWRANRLLLVGVPGGSFSEGRAGSEPAVAQRYVGLVQQFRPAIGYVEVGKVPDRRITVAAPMLHSAPVGGTWAPIRIDLTDDQLPNVREIELGYTQHVMDKSCQVESKDVEKSEGGFVHVIDAELLAKPEGGTSTDDRTRVDWPEGRNAHRLILTVNFNDVLANYLAGSTCEGSWWSFVDVTVTAKLKSGSRIQFHGGTVMGRAAEARLTLVLPTPGSAADLRAAPGWEMSGSDLLDGHSLGLSALLDKLSRSTAAQGTWPWQTLTSSRGCMFAGAAAVTADLPRFQRCLIDSHRLALIAPDIDTISAAETGGVSTLMTLGRLETLIAAPEYGNSDFAALPEWARPGSSLGPPTVSMPLLVASHSTNALITRGRKLRVEQQSDVITSLFTIGEMGSAEDKKQCQSSSLEAVTEFPAQFWLAPLLPPAPVPPTAPGGLSHAQLRLRGVLAMADSAPTIFPSTFAPEPERERLGSNLTFEDNVACDNPVKRAVDAVASLDESGLYVPSANTQLSRAAVILFTTDEVYPHLVDAVPSACAMGAPERYQSADIASRLSRFAANGGRFLIQPVRGPGAEESELYRQAVEGIDGSAAQATDLLIEAIGVENAAAVELLPAMDGTSSPNDAAAGLRAGLEKGWMTGARNLSAYSLGSGAVGTRNAACAFDGSLGLIKERYSCRYTPTVASSPPAATALNRIVPVPEFFSTFAARGEDPYLTGQLIQGDGAATLIQVRPFGVSRTVFVGYSPFARDQLALDFVRAPDDPVLKHGLCFLMDNGTTSAYLRRDETFPRAGGMKLLDRFARAFNVSEDAPQVDTIVDRDVTTGAFTLVAYARQGSSSSWSWRPALLNEKREPFSPGDAPASIVLQSYEPTSGQARLRVIPRKPDYHGALRISLSEAADPVILPAVFPPPENKIDLSRVIQLLGKEGQQPALTLDMSLAAVLFVTLCALAMLSPISRSWSAAFAYLRKLNKHLPRGPAELQVRAAPLLALHAALAEWGVHPGEPAAARNAGLPAGVRQWRAGDAGRAIIPASLFGLLRFSEAIPPIRPKVRLKTASQAISVLVLVDGGGALAYPPGNVSPSKLDFAAALAAFLAAAVELSHGRATVARGGRDAIASGDVEQTRANMAAELAKPSPDDTPPVPRPYDPLDRTWTERSGWAADIQRHGGAAMVFLIVDGLTINRRDLILLMDSLAVEGGQLRVAALVSRDDRTAATLYRDPRNGAFEDASEVHPDTYIKHRDDRLDAAAHELQGRGAMLVTIPVECNTQEFLMLVNQTGLLR